MLVPYPHATADHQTANARWMEQGGAAVAIADEALTPEGLRAAVDAIVLDPARLQAMAEASARLARPDAARDVARRGARRRERTDRLGSGPQFVQSLLEPQVCRATGR